MSDADLHFYFDPVCPFAWMTSKWVRIVQRQRNYSVEWRFISLRLINAGVDYDAHFPPEYEAGHTAGLRLLRMAARTGAEHGPDAVGRLYEQLGTRIFEDPRADESADTRREQGSRDFAVAALRAVDLPETLADALEDDAWDAELQASTDTALALTGKDVGTPILHFEPASETGGVAFFGPVISRLPDEQQAAELWDHVIGLASFGGFAELKRSLRERPQLPGLGVDPDEIGLTEDWHGGSRRLKK
ncbi:MAG: hypothetical protein QOG60_1697 [Frankiaceae bacterium]|nr:hypothetical protein [Frankiaceae bacterium]